MARISNVKHPYVTRVKGVCGGQPVVRGTRFPVGSVVLYVLRQGMTPEEMVREWPHMTLAQIYDALSYYHDHKGEIDKLIRRNASPALRRRAAI